MASVDHHWKSCPYESDGNEEKYVDLNKSNHFFHDSLGCPFECAGDHNHPKERVKT